MVGVQLGVRTVGAHDRLVEDLEAESADVANLVAAVEERYQVSVKESEIAKIITPNDLFRTGPIPLKINGPAERRHNPDGIAHPACGSKWGQNRIYI